MSGAADPRHLFHQEFSTSIHAGLTRQGKIQCGVENDGHVTGVRSGG